MAGVGIIAQRIARAELRAELRGVAPHRLKSRRSVRIMIIATIPVSSSTIASELMIENQWIWSSPM